MDTAGIYIEKAPDWFEHFLPAALMHDSDIDQATKGVYWSLVLEAGLNHPSEDRDQYLGMIADLERAGWLTRRLVAEPDGSSVRWVTVWTLHSAKLPESERTSPGSLS